ncbi:MAG: hypothetical protein ACJAZW_002892 [Maritalea sp.]|jgi:hypothetical protein
MCQAHLAKKLHIVVVAAVVVNVVHVGQMAITAKAAQVVRTAASLKVAVANVQKSNVAISLSRVSQSVMIAAVRNAVDLQVANAAVVAKVAAIAHADQKLPKAIWYYKIWEGRCISPAFFVGGCVC